MLIGEEVAEGTACVNSFRGPVEDPQPRAILTGDTLFQGNVGRVAGPNAVRPMFESLQRIKALGDEVHILPAHHYGFCTSTTVAVEKKMNTMFGKCKTVEQFAMVSGVALPEDGRISKNNVSGSVDDEVKCQETFSINGRTFTACRCCRPMLTDEDQVCRPCL